jgi:hypothetical protein
VLARGRSSRALERIEVSSPAAQQPYLETLHRDLALAHGDAVWAFARIEWATYEMLRGINTYGYVGQRPTQLTDRSGLAAPAAAGLCFVPGVGWVGCGVAAVGVGAVACFATGVCQKAITGVGQAIKDICSDDR